jgi:hypothetical protein
MSHEPVTVRSAMQFEVLAEPAVRGSRLMAGS